MAEPDIDPAPAVSNRDHSDYENRKERDFMTVLQMINGVLQPLVDHDQYCRGYSRDLQLFTFVDKFILMTYLVKALTRSGLTAFRGEVQPSVAADNLLRETIANSESVCDTINTNMQELHKLLGERLRQPGRADD